MLQVLYISAGIIIGLVRVVLAYIALGILLALLFVQCIVALVVFAGCILCWVASDYFADFIGAMGFPTPNLPNLP